MKLNEDEIRDHVRAAIVNTITESNKTNKTGGEGMGESDDTEGESGEMDDESLNESFIAEMGLIAAVTGLVGLAHRFRSNALKSEVMKLVMNRFAPTINDDLRRVARSVKVVQSATDVKAVMSDFEKITKQLDDMERNIGKIDEDILKIAAEKDAARSFLTPKHNPISIASVRRRVKSETQQFVKDIRSQLRTIEATMDARLDAV